MDDVRVVTGLGRVQCIFVLLKVVTVSWSAVRPGFFLFVCLFKETSQLSFPSFYFIKVQGWIRGLGD